jgi:acyl-CoA synthetase (AMP-forming)/AMP-acid ligase II
VAGRTAGDREAGAALYPPHGLDFLAAFLGCLYSGAVAVSAPLPGDARRLARVVRILTDADIRIVLTESTYRDLLSTGLREAGFAGATCVATDTAALADPDTWRMPDLDGDTLAFLQYTSGSPNEPKGVMVTQGNLLWNAEEIHQVLGPDSDTVTVSWLPQYHDMGLIGMWLEPLYVGATAYYLSPIAFLKRPYRWLDAISRHRATMTAAPDFAYELCTRRVTDEQLAGLDLSSLEVALNGAEPVRSRTLEAFTRRFGSAGLGPEVLTPCYGMAEVTLFATGSGPGIAPVSLDVDPAALERHGVRPVDGEGGVRLVSSGRPGRLDMRVVDPDSLDALPDHRVGEIWIRGGNVAAGYWNRPELTEETFHAYTSSGWWSAAACPGPRAARCSGS